MARYSRPLRRDRPALSGGYWPLIPMTTKPHKWIDFYSPVIGMDRATQLVIACHQGPAANRAKLILYQTQRLVTLADEILRIRPGRESLQLLFLLICAENVAKLADRFESDGKSRFYVKEFFRRFTDVDDRRILDTGFTTFSHKLLGWEAAIDALYGVRCDVVHEGNYWDFHFRDDDTWMLNQDPNLIARISLQEFRDLVVRSAASAVQASIDWDGTG